MFISYYGPKMRPIFLLKLDLRPPLISLIGTSAPPSPGKMAPTKVRTLKRNSYAFWSSGVRFILTRKHVRDRKDVGSISPNLSNLQPQWSLKPMETLQ